MFLRGSPDLAPVYLLVNPQLETPFCTQKTSATYSPAGCPGKGQLRDTIDGGSKVVYPNQDGGRKTRPNFSVRENPSRARTRFDVAATITNREERHLIGAPAARYANQNWEEKTRPSFCVKETIFPARTDFTFVAKLT